MLFPICMLPLHNKKKLILLSLKLTWLTVNSNKQKELKSHFHTTKLNLSELLCVYQTVPPTTKSQQWEHFTAQSDLQCLQKYFFVSEKKSMLITKQLNLPIVPNSLNGSKKSLQMLSNFPLSSWRDKMSIVV